MKTKNNFCGIFATAFIVATVALASSCSQDDEYYDSDMYTLAEKMETRSGGDPGGDGGFTISDSIINTYEIVFKRMVGNNHYYCHADVMVRMYRSKGVPCAELIEYHCLDPLFRVENVYMERIPAQWGYLLKATGSNEQGHVYSGTLENIIFF